MKKKRSFITAIPFLLVALGSSSALAAELVTNGDFENGNTGFTTDYTFVPSTPSETPDTYGIRQQSTNFNPGYYPFGDHTTGTGLMMLVDGYPVAGKTVWSETIPTLASSNYSFSAWAISSDDVSPATLEFFINGVQLGSDFVLPSTIDWQNFTSMWNSGVATSATITIVDTNTVELGNDFALDDLSFNGPAVGSVPETGSTAVFLSIGLLALIGLGRKGPWTLQPENT